jgi:hypothetical protein
MAAGLQHDPAMLAAGRADRAAGRPWRLTPSEVLSGEVDVVAYASGFFGQRFGR